MDTKLRVLIAAPGAKSFVAAVVVLPSGHRWDTASGGRHGDATHPMVPFAGAGVNFAMTDDADLVIAPAKAKSPFELMLECVRVYDSAM